MSRRSRPEAKRAKKRQQRSRNSKQKTNKQDLGTLLNWLLPDASIFAKIKLHGNTKWLPMHLVWLALFWSWSESVNVTDAFTEAVGCCTKVVASSPLSTYQGFMGAMVTWTEV